MKNIQIVLVKPKYQENIGFTARILKNFNFSNLVIIKPQTEIGKIAEYVSCRGKSVLKKAVIIDDLNIITRNSSLVIGASAKIRSGRRKYHLINHEECSCLIQKRNTNSKISILFGAEDTGLEKEAITKCQYLVKIPADKKYTSINLSHSVGIICYEIFKKNFSEKLFIKNKKVNPYSFVRLIREFEDILILLKNSNLRNNKNILRILTNIFSRAELEQNECNLMLGILKELKKTLILRH